MRKVKKIENAILAVCLMLFSSQIKAQKKLGVEDVIIWSKSRLLTWNDFEKIGYGDGENNNKAISVIELSFIPVYYTDKTFSFEVVSYFVRKHSKTTTICNELLLNHEQYHFNIAELLARKFREHQHGLGKKNLSRYEYDLLINWFKKVYQSYQDNYDRETKHGASSTDQKNWEKKIDVALQDLENYKLY